MSPLGEQNANASEDVEFSWGRKVRLDGKNHNRQYYKSFTYDGMEYLLYDSVYIWSTDHPKPHIGKIVEMYETAHLDKRVKVVWYFRPEEVETFLKGTSTLNNELFLGSGEGKGLFNDNALETISGVCNVICTSKDERNRKASNEELKNCDYFFDRTFDVEKCRISERFPDKIAGIEGIVSWISLGLFSIVLSFPAANVGRLTYSSSNASDSHHSKKRKVLDPEVDNLKKRLKVDSSEWFKQQSWEERMQKAHETGSLVLLENLDPSLTSLDVEDIVSNAFNRKATAKMMQHNTFSSPSNGQAFVIFNSIDEADFAISELQTKCLIIRGVRPVVGSRPSLKEFGNHSSKYFGHFIIDTMKQKQWIDKRDGVSTAHYSQPNTIEFEMGMEWQALQQRWEICWDALYQQQATEIGSLKSRLKHPPSNK